MCVRRLEECTVHIYVLCCTNLYCVCVLCVNIAVVGALKIS